MTVRAIINRGGEQGAQHSQALHSWFAHVPGLKVVMPYSASDAYNMLIASVFDNSPVVFIDDRWLYENSEILERDEGKTLDSYCPIVRRQGTDLTIAAAGYSVKIALEAAEKLQVNGISSEVVDIRLLKPFDPGPIINSVNKTRKLFVIDGGNKTAGYAAEIISSVVENLNEPLKVAPVRITLPDSPAPTSNVQENIYYPKADTIISEVKRIIKENRFK